MSTLKRAFKKIFSYDGGTINPAYSMLQIDDGANEIIAPLAQEARTENSELGKTALNFTTSIAKFSGSAINFFVGYHRFFGGMNVRKLSSDFGSRRQAGLYDWLTLGIP